MAHNHLIIGLGGTGGSIIRSFRKTVYQQFKGDDPKDVNFQYLYIDSDDGDMDPTNQSWTILGHSVSLEQINRLPISGLNLKKVLENLADYKNIQPWIGNRSDWADILNSLDSSKVVGSQKRRLGRFLFASHAKEFRQRIGTFVRNMEEDHSRTLTSMEGVDRVTFHVCCGLSGGTGSGTVVDVISQIRAEKPEAGYRIIVYAQLPERSPAPGRDRGNYHANAYAALMELNALKINSWQPHDISSYNCQRLKIQDPFNCCYLFSNQNAKVTVSMDELPDIVASFLFQKIVLAPNINWDSAKDQFRRTETFENTEAGIKPEVSPLVEARRTRSFLSFGIKQIAYPEVEISEYLTYSFAQQAALQMLYNNLDEKQESGYQEAPLKFDCTEFVSKPDQQERWYLDDQHLMLSRGILQSEINNKTWRPIGEFWKALVPNYVVHVLDQYKDNVNKMMPELIKLCVTAYDEQYRGTGVRSFYKTKLGDNNKAGDIRDQVSEVRQRIEADLFEDWRNGERSMHDIGRIVSSLIGALQSKLQNIDLSISRASENGERYKLNETRYADNNKAWARLGPLSIAIGKHKKILNAQAEVLVAKYTVMTELEGYRYARKLVESLLHELDSLSASIGYCEAMIIEALAASKAGVASRLADGGKSDIGKQMVRHYDPEVVRRFVDDLSHDAVRQRKQAGEVRERLTSLLKGKRTFANFSQTIQGVVFKNILSESCARSAAADHLAAIQSDKSRGGILQVSLIEILSREFGGNDADLRQYARDIMKWPSSYLLIDKEEKGRHILNDPLANRPDSGICESTNIIITPEGLSGNDFLDKFCTALSASSLEGEPIVVTNKSRPQEISIVTLTSVFPARMAKVVTFLKEKYDARIAAEGKRAFLELHSEGEDLELANGQELFDLFPDAYRSADNLPWIMLAQGLGLIVSSKEKTGRDMLYLSTKDKDGFEDNRPLGPNLTAVIERIDPEAMETMKFIVRKLLNDEYLHVTKRKEIENSILAQVRATAESMGTTSQLYNDEREALPSVRKILEIEA